MPFGTPPRGADGIPLGSGYVSGVDFRALQGSPMVDTDAMGNQSSGVVAGDQVQVAIMQGKGYVASTTIFATATNGNLVMGMSVFNPSTSGKSLYIYSIRWHSFQNTASLKYYLTTANPTFATALTPQNLKAGGSASVALVTSAANLATASLTPTGTQQDVLFAASMGSFEFLPSNGAGILLPAGSANGVAVFGTVVAAGNNWGASMQWIEF